MPASWQRYIHLCLDATSLYPNMKRKAEKEKAVGSIGGNPTFWIVFARWNVESRSRIFARWRAKANRSNSSFFSYDIYDLFTHMHTYRT